jgi:hypothetical protein
MNKQTTKNDTDTLKAMTVVTGFLAMLSLGFFTAATVTADTTYYYVNADGELRAEVADSPQQAIAQAENIKDNSGVIEADELDEEMSDNMDSMDDMNADMDSESDSFLYVDEDGNLESEDADTPAEALSEADDIKDNSGVIDEEDFNELADSNDSDDMNTDSSVTTMNMTTFAYVAMDGTLQFETAVDWQAAINQAMDIDPNSGVIVITR